MSDDTKRDCERNGDVAAYVLGALDEGEARDLRRHFDDCRSCREEAESLREAVAILPADVEQIAPPPELKHRIMAEVEAQAEILRAAGPSADRAPAGRRSRRWRALAALPVAAAVAAVVVVLAVSGGGSTHRVIQAAVEQRLAPGASARVVISGHSSTLEVKGMPPPPGGRIYEVWLRRGSSAPVATHSLFDVPRDGDASVSVGDDLRGVSQLMVTAEPAGGSTHPTSPPVLVARIA